MRATVIAEAYEAVVSLDDVFGEPQAKSGPGVSLRSEKGFEEPVARLGPDAFAVIDHRDPYTRF